MTVQASDIVRYGEHTYCVAGVKGIGLFLAGSHGLSPNPCSTNCWRGYVCTYAVIDGMLMLDGLDIRLAESVQEASSRQSPLLNGVKPVALDDEVFDTRYSHIGLPVSFTGGLVIGWNFIYWVWVPAGFHPAWNYQYVHELLFTEGRLRQSRDVSERTGEFRGETGDIEQRAYLTGSQFVPFRPNQDEAIWESIG